MKLQADPKAHWVQFVDIGSHDLLRIFDIQIFLSDERHEGSKPGEIHRRTARAEFDLSP